MVLKMGMWDADVNDGHEMQGSFRAPRTTQLVDNCASVRRSAMKETLLLLLRLQTQRPWKHANTQTHTERQSADFENASTPEASTESEAPLVS